MNTIPTVTPVNVIPTVQPISRKAVFTSQDVVNTFERDIQKQHDKNWMDYKARVMK